MAPQIAPDEVDMALLPGLAFDLWGTRLGRGAGYFDEFLASASRSLTKVGVVPTPLVVDRLPREAHDQQMSFLATEEGVVGVAKE
jgi:5-formyltetrahydrofolate cyclo-ligase